MIPPSDRLNKKKWNKGFTLLELMIVLGIAAFVTTMAITRMDNKNSQLKSSVRKLSTLIKELHSSSKLKGVTYRLVFDLGDPQERDDNEQSYWVEVSSQKVLISDDEEEEEEPDEDEESKAPQVGFERDEKYNRKEFRLPEVLKVVGVDLAGVKEMVVSGKAQIYFFPQGMVQEAAIQLSAGDRLNWTLVIHPLTGKAHVLTQKTTLAELKK